MASQPLGFMVHILVFLGCMALAGVANRVTFRPVWNGALIYLVLAVLWTTFQLVALHAASSPVPEHLRAYASGQIIGQPLLVVLVAIYYAWKFVRDHRASPTRTASDTPGWMDGSSAEEKAGVPSSNKADEIPAWLRSSPKKKSWWRPY